jgi:succinate dehydrogenase / fumarate reductase, cytochrome b subunit
MIKGPRNIRLIDIARYRFPITAITSILHRISGVIIFLLIPFVLWLLHASLVSPQSFLLVKDFMGSLWVCFGVWVVAVAAFYHLVAGIKHFIMDIGHLEEHGSGPKASWVVFILGIIGAIAMGVWILC